MSCVLLNRGGGASPLAEKLWCEHMNKIVERKAFIDTIRIHCVELRNIILFKMFTASCVSLA